ncbi:MAG TPA: type IX secretion system membrane protein PorP/SprF [Sphingobacteriaceae bacterium]
MRKVLGLLLGISLSAMGQQRPQYTQYVFNNYILNPAITGIENYMDVKAGYRSQWEGLTDAPATSSISLHLPLGKSFLWSNANSFSEKGSNPMNRSYLQTYRASESHHGVGFHLVTDRAGPISRTDINATYAYHLGISEQLNISVGVAGGVSMLHLDLSKVRLEQVEDRAVMEGENARTQPDLAMGVWLYSARYFAGISAQQLLGRPIAFTSDPAYDQGKQVPHFFITGGYKFFLNDDMAAIPSIMVKSVSPAPVSVDANLKVAFKDKFWLGGSYRKNDSFAAMAGFNLSYLFNLSYAYDFTTSDIKSVSGGSHEIVLGLLLNNRYRVTCPQKNW